MTAYEYRQVDSSEIQAVLRGGGPYYSLTDRLTALSQEGWDVCAGFSDVSGMTTYLLRRAIDDI